MSFYTGLEELLDKVAALRFKAPAAGTAPQAAFARPPHPAPVLRPPSVAQAAPPAPAFARQLGPGLPGPDHPYWAQQAVHEQNDPAMHGVQALSDQHYQQAGSQPTASPVAPAAPVAPVAQATSTAVAAAPAPNAARGGFLRRAAVPLGLAAGAAMIGHGLSNSYDEDQRYKNLAYAPVGANAF